jgi:hypothetical protein
VRGIYAMIRGEGRSRATDIPEDGGDILSVHTRPTYPVSRNRAGWRCRIASCILVGGLILVAGLSSSAAASQSVASSLGAVQGVGCDGKPLKWLGLSRPDGTAFLIGPRLMMTASHVVFGWVEAGACSIRVRLDGQWYYGSKVVYWADAPGRSYWAVPDIATFALDRPASGRILPIHQGRSPSRGSAVTAWGIPSEQAATSRPATLTKGAVVNANPVLVFTPLGFLSPSSGGPIVDRKGAVVSVTSRIVGTTPEGKQQFRGIDLAEWWGPTLWHDVCKLYTAHASYRCATARRSVPPHSSKSAITISKARKS